MSKTDLAHATGLHPLRITQIETDHEPGSPARQVVDVLAQHLHVSAEWLRYGTDKEKMVDPIIAIRPPHDPPPQLLDTPIQPLPPETKMMLPSSEEPALATLAERVKHAREQAHLTQGMLAREAEVSLVVVQRLEEDPQFDTPQLSKIARVLRCDMNWLREVTLAGRVRAVRMLRGMSEVQLARAIDEEERHIVLVETGGSRQPIFLPKLAAALRVGEGYLLTGQGVPPEREPLVDQRQQDETFQPPATPASKTTIPIDQIPMPGTTVGQRLKVAREARGFGLDKLGSLVGCTGTNIAFIERGTTKNSKFLPDIAKALNVSLEWLTGTPAETSTSDLADDAEWVEITPEIIERLQEARTARNFTTYDLSKAIKRSDTFVYALEMGKQIRTKDLPDIARALGVSLEWLVHGEGDEPGMEITTPPVDIVDQETSPPEPIPETIDIGPPSHSVRAADKIAEETHAPAGAIVIQPTTMFHFVANDDGANADLVFGYEQRVAMPSGEITTLESKLVAAVCISREMIAALHKMLGDALRLSQQNAAKMQVIESEPEPEIDQTDPEAEPQPEPQIEPQPESSDLAEDSDLAIWNQLGAHPAANPIDKRPEMAAFPEPEPERAPEAPTVGRRHPGGKTARVPDEVREQIRALWNSRAPESGLTMTGLGRQFGISGTTVKDILLPPLPPRPPRNLSDNERGKILRLAGKGKTYIELSQKFGVSVWTVRRLVTQHAGKQAKGRQSRGSSEARENSPAEIAAKDEGS